jgi:hypothetical protein
MQNILLPEQRQNIQKPFPRNIAYTEYVSKPCLYTAVQSVTLGGAGSCKIEFKTGANIKVTSPSIKLTPGVKVEKGALFSAKAGSVVNGLKSATIASPKAKVNYLTPSEYSGLIFDYSTGENLVSIKNSTHMANTISVYPNPVNKFLTVNSTKPLTGILEISNMYGQIVLKQPIYNTLKTEVEVAGLKNDMYILKITGSINYSTKIIKQ